MTEKGNFFPQKTSLSQPFFSFSPKSNQFFFQFFFKNKLLKMIQEFLKLTFPRPRINNSIFQRILLRKKGFSPATTIPLTRVSRKAFEQALYSLGNSGSSSCMIIPCKLSDGRLCFTARTVGTTTTLALTVGLKPAEEKRWAGLIVGRTNCRHRLCPC